jgi:hypothetical protein
MLVVWGEKYAYGSQTENVTVQFDETFANIKVYNPAQYDVSQPNKGTQPIRTEQNTNSVTLEMLDYPYILEFESTASQPTCHDITVENGKAGNDNSAVLYGMFKIEKAAEGDIIKIVADQHPQGKPFLKWESGDVTFTDANNAISAFTMPANAVSVKATYDDGTSLLPVKMNNGISMLAGKGKIILNTDRETLYYSIYNIIGQTVAQGSISGSREIALPKGIYIVNANNTTIKLIVE